jgi:L-serine dehydratase
MVGPSSSHTAGACRIGLVARCLVGGTPQRASIELHGSFARTGEGHGTDKAIVGGLMGFKPDDERLRDALTIAEREGLDYRFEKTKLGDEAVSEIDGFPVEVTGNYHTLVLVAEDIRGSIAAIATILAERGVNIANLKLTRKERGGDAFMVIDLDDPPETVALAEIRALSWVKLAMGLDKVSA